MNPRRTASSELPDAVVWGFFGVIVAVPLVIWLAAQLAGLAVGDGPPGVGVDDAARAVPRLVSSPAKIDEAFGVAMPGPGVFWSAVVASTVMAVVPAGVVAVRLARRAGRAGMARRSDVKSLAARSLVARAKILRPDLPADADRRRVLAAAGVKLGRHHPSGAQLYGSIEDSYLVIAPPRTGKTGRVVIPTVLDHDGPAVVTSTRWEIVERTAASRAQRGPVWVFDVDQSSPVSLPDYVEAAAWSPVAGCEDPQTAMIRARSLARAAGAASGVENRDFWATLAIEVLQCYLHAAAIGNRTMADVRGWSMDPDRDRPQTILQSSELAPEWSGALAAQVKKERRQRDGIWGVVTQALFALSDPRFLRLCSPKQGEGFNAAALLERNGTLYVTGRSETQDIVAPLVAALVESVTSEARARAGRRPGGRLSPPLLVALDEAANIAPLPTLPGLVADGGGSGITTMVVLQSRARARERWGDDGADAIVAACTHRLVLGGGGELAELDDLARLVGERDEEIRSHSWQSMSAGGTSSTSTSLRRVPIITPADLQSMPKSRGVLCSPNAPPAEVVMEAWWERRDADMLREPPTGHVAMSSPKPGPVGTPPGEEVSDERDELDDE